MPFYPSAVTRVNAVDRSGLDVFYEDGAPKVMGADSLGTAAKPAH